MTLLAEHFLSGRISAALEVALPAAGTRWPCVLLLHGSFGMLPAYRPDIVAYADALALAGIAVAIPHYLDATVPKTAPGVETMQAIPQRAPAWRVACRDALAAVAADARFDATRLGVLGFSLGGHLALGLAMEPPAGLRPKAVVDYFGPTQGLAPRWPALPPVQIFHGSDDRVVAPSESARLVAELEKAGRKAGAGFEMHVVPGQGHGFTGSALQQARAATVAFFRKTL